MRIRVVFITTGFVIAIALSSIGVSAQETRLIGSGASFPFPIYSVWFKDFSKKSKGVTVDYQAKGSGAGVQDFINGTVDFAGSDAAMTDEEIAKVHGGVVLLPITAGEIVLAYNLPGSPKGLKLSRDVYSDIFLGKITKWNDPRITAANPDLKLPDLLITVVRRSDSSGTTFVFTKHLAAINEAFAREVGAGTTVQWPKGGKMVAAPKNDGVTATIKQTPGSIGYIEYGYAKLTKANSAALQNKAGVYVEANAKSGSATLASATLGPDLRGWIEDPTGEDAYPIATFTWLLVYKQQDEKKAEWLHSLVDYCATEGQSVADSMGYIPLPESVVQKIKAASSAIR